MHILYVGPEHGTCLHRAQALRRLGHEVTRIPSGEPDSTWRFQLYRVANRLGDPADLVGANRNINRLTGGGGVDLVWIDKGLTIAPQTLARVRETSPRTPLVSYSPDDMLNPQNQSRRYLDSIEQYHLHVTTKSYNVAELRELGARDVLFVDNAYDPESHRPLELTDEERNRYRADVGFVGMYEPDRAQQMLRLAEEGIPVTIWGGGWERLERNHADLTIHNEAIWDMKYAKAINATKINLGFLRKVNRDLQTTRSIEIPACGAFMLAERTEEHLRLFEEGTEAEFFDSFAELLSQCRYYLEHDEQRARIAEAGRRRCVEGGYSNDDRLRGVLDYLKNAQRRRD